VCVELSRSYGGRERGKERKRERERGREGARERERERVNGKGKKRGTVREGRLQPPVGQCVCVCARARERERVRERKRKIDRERESESARTPATHARRRDGVYDARDEKRMGHLQDQPQPALI